MAQWRGKKTQFGKKKYLRMIPPASSYFHFKKRRDEKRRRKYKFIFSSLTYVRGMVAGVGEFFFVLWDENWLVYYTRMTRQVLNHANYSFFPENTEFFFCHALGFKLPFPIPPQKKLSPNFLHIYRNTLLQRKILFLINVLLGMTSLIKTSLGEKHKRARYKMKNRSDKCGKL